MPLPSLARVILETAKEPKDPSVPNNQDLPRNEMDIFYRTIYAFIPEGKKWEDLTPKEQAEVKAKYRFDALRPGTYQGITGIGSKMAG